MLVKELSNPLERQLVRSCTTGFGRALSFERFAFNARRRPDTKPRDDQPRQGSYDFEVASFSVSMLDSQ